jgi:ATP-binding cassette subfamily B protein
MNATTDRTAATSSRAPVLAQQASPLSNWSVFRQAAFQRPRAWFPIALLSVLSTILALLAPWPAKLIIDNVIGDQPLSAQQDRVLDAVSLQSEHELLAFLALLSILIVFGQLLTDARLTMRTIRLSQSMAFELGARLFAHLQRRSLTFHARTPVGESMSRITGDTWSVDQIASKAIIGPFQTLLTVGGAAWVLGQLDRTLTLAVLAIAPITVAASTTLGRSVHQVARQRRENQAVLQAHVAQMLTATTIIQGFSQERRFSDRFRAIVDDSIRIERRSAILGGLNELASGLASTLGFAVVLWLAADKAMSGAMTVGTLLIFVAYMQVIQTQLRSLAGVVGTIQQSRAGLGRVTDVLNDEPEISAPPGAPDIEATRGEVRLEGVSFEYERNLPILRDVCLTISPGEIVAIIGPSGAGKTTLASLLPRFLDPCEGTVRIDGTDIRSVDLQSVRRAVSVVPQQPVLLPVSVAENIAYGRPGASHAEIVEAARNAAADDFIVQLPDGYETVIGERGDSLSGGQRQRIAIARALLTTAPILVLDEPTSALDSSTELALIRTLRELRGKRTVLLIAHRLTTAAVADRIIVLREGRIAGEGAPYQILSNEGLTGDADWVAGRAS